MTGPGEWTSDWLAGALPGPNPTLLRRLSVGTAFLDHPDEPPGSCILVVDSPLVQQLNDLPRERRLRFLGDLDLLGEAVHNVFRRRDPEFRCVDLEIPGDGDLLIAHVRPRCIREGATATRSIQHDDTELLDELDRISAAGRGDYPSQLVYRSRPAPRPVYHHLP